MSKKEKVKKEKKQRSKTYKIVRSILIVLGCIILLFVGVVGGYVTYITAKYSRIGDMPLTVSGSARGTLEADTEYKIVTYNIGFGAYSPDFDFFMDGGKGSVAKDKETVEYNTRGNADIINKLGADFALLQEMDIDSTRSKHVNQYETIGSLITKSILAEAQSYCSVSADYFKSPYLFYPLTSPIGSIHSALATFSRFQVASAERKELPVSTSWPGKLFDLDRCYTISRVPYGAKELVIMNIHLTAFESTGGTIREKQLNEVKDQLLAEKAAGNFVILGGDFNHDLITTYGGNPEDYFEYTKPNEDWIAYIPDDFKTFLAQNGYNFFYPTNEPTCRSSAYAYEEGVSRVWVIDGFIVSDNITVTSVHTADAGDGGYENFMYSDHNPVCLTFELPLI